jgi:hypothetical protein
VTTTSNATAVISLAAYREAVRAAVFLRGCLHDPAWLKDVVPELGANGEARVTVVLFWHTTLIRRCLPTRVNGVEVNVKVVE